MKLEFLLRKLSDFLQLSIIDSGSNIVLKGGNIKIEMENSKLKVKTDAGEAEIDESEVEDFKFFDRTKHCTIRLRNGGYMRIYAEEGGRFKFFLKF